MTIVERSATRPPRTSRIAGLHRTSWLILAASIVVIAFVRVVTGAEDITSANTLRAAIIAACPILMAGLGGLWSERAGVVNIGLEGQMLLGTWGAAYFAYYYGPWVGVLGAAVLGAVGGLLHALATVSFGVDQIVSGVAINIIGLGATTFLAAAFFTDLDGGGPRQLVGLDPLPYLTVPGVSDGAVDLAAKHWFVVSDVAAVVAALTTRVSALTVIVAVLVVATAWILWRTSFGLRLRSCGENPAAAESLGVNVYRYKYIAVVVSGAMAGIGGGFLALVSSSGFNTNQTNGRGYIGLAAMIFGNWRPGGTVGASVMFGYTDSLRLRDPGAVHSLLLLVAIGLGAFALWRLRQGARTSAIVIGVLGIAFLVWFLTTDTVPREFTGMTPYIATIFVLALASQSLRMPAADGQPYRKGSAG